MPGGGPDRLVAAEGDVDDRADVLGVPDGRDAADRVAGLGTDVLGVGLLDLGQAGEVGDLVDVDAVAAGGEDEQGQALALVRRRDEDEAVRDLRGGDPEGLGGGLGGAHGDGQVAHLGDHVVQREGLHDRQDAGVSREVSRRRDDVARLWGHASSLVTSQGLDRASVEEAMVVL